jgi:putative endonuclease
VVFWNRKSKNVWTRGEDAATKHMRSLGCKVLARNFRIPIGEIDLLCFEKKTSTIILVEVKARLVSTDQTKHIDPTANITAKKRAKLVSLAKALKKNPRYQPHPIRIDVVSVRFIADQRQPEIDHYPGCVSDS